jgi:glycosyltransferase involved in cell wall biosynthesis
MTAPRIVLLHYTAFPVIGGVEKVMAHHARLLAADGRTAVVVAGRGDPSSQVILPELDTAHPEVRLVLRSLTQAEVPREFAALQRRIRETLAPHLERADVLILHNVLHLHLNLPLTAALHEWIERHPERRIVSWCHDISRYLRPSSGETLREGFPWNLLRTRQAGVSYVAVSSARRDLLAEIMRCEAGLIRVVPNGVDPASLLGFSEAGRRIAERLQWSAADLILFLPVRLTRAKNIEFALRLTAALRDSGVAPRMLVSGPPDPHTAGIGAYIDHLRKLRTALNLETEAHFLFEELSGKGEGVGVDDDVMGELYRMCDIVLMPSLREGFGMPVLEAGLVGRTVFATKMPALETIDSSLIHLIRAGDSPGDSARKILAWMESDREYRLRRSIRRTLTWEAVYRNHLRDLVTERSGSGEAAA